MRYVILIVIAALWTTSAAAQTKDNRLRGLRQLDLLVERLDKDEDAKKCGLSHNDLRDAFLGATQYAPFRWDQDAQEYVYINPTILAVGDNQCIYNLNIQLIALQTVQVSQSRRSFFGPIMLWQHTALGQSPPRIFAQRVRNVVKEIAEDLVRDWNLDNR